MARNPPPSGRRPPPPPPPPPTELLREGSATPRLVHPAGAARYVAEGPHSGTWVEVDARGRRVGEAIYLSPPAFAPPVTEASEQWRPTYRVPVRENPDHVARVTAISDPSARPDLRDARALAFMRWTCWLAPVAAAIWGVVFRRLGWLDAPGWWAAILGVVTACIVVQRRLPRAHRWPFEWDVCVGCGATREQLVNGDVGRWCGG